MKRSVPCDSGTDDGVDARSHLLARDRSQSSGRTEFEIELRAARAEIACLLSAGEAARAVHQKELQSHSTEFATRLRDQRAKLSEAITRCEMEMQIIRQQTMFNARLHRELSIANQRVSQLEEMVRQMLQSTSWRLTAPLRFAMLRFRLTAIGRCFGQFGKR